MIDQLTAVRGVLAFWVVMYHYSDQGFAPEMALVRPITERGYLAVDGFFVLSGLIIAYVYGEPLRTGTTGTRDFIVARLSRIYPAHATVMVGLLVLSVAGQAIGVRGEHATAWNFLAHLLLVDAWGTTKSISWNAPSWSISAEWFAYLLAPGLLLRLLPRRPLVHGVVVVAAFVALGAAEATHPEQQLNWTNAMSLVRVVSEFCLGVIIASWASPSTRRRPALAAVAGATFAAGMFSQADVLVVCALALCLWTVFEWPSSRTPQSLIRLGEWSYAIYLVQFFVMVVFRFVSSQLGDTAYAAWPLLGSSLLAVTVAGWMLYRWVEVPARRRLRARFDVRYSQSAPAA